MGKFLLLIAVLAAAWLLWRRGRGGRPSMPVAEAQALLGVGEQAGIDEIREAHRRLIARVHPDAGGSAELATRVNAARDALLRELRRKPPRLS